MRILRQVEIVVVLILLANSMLSFCQYELKSSYTHFRGSISMRFKSLEPPQLSLRFLIGFQIC